MQIPFGENQNLVFYAGIFALSVFSRRGFHGQRDSASVNIDIDDRYHDILVNLDDIRRILHEPVRQLANVNQAILVYSNIYKSSECSDVGDNAWKLHAGP